MSGDTAPDRNGEWRAIAVWTAAAVLLFGTLSAPHWATAGAGGTRDGLTAVAFGGTLALLSAIDVQTFRLPSVLTYPLGVSGLLQGWFTAPDDILLRGLGAVAGFAMLALIADLYRRRRGIDGLGLGDAKLMGAGGAWIGLEGLPSALLLASGLALVMAIVAKLAGKTIRADTRLPFGPFIAIGLWIVWIYGPIV